MDNLKPKNNPVVRPKAVRKKLIYRLMYAAIIILVAGLAYFAWSHYAGRQPYKHKYSAQVDYKQAGQKPGTGFSLKAPTEFKNVSLAELGPNNNTRELSLTDTVPNIKPATVRGIIAGESVVSGLPGDPDFRTIAQKAFANPSDVNYPNFTRAINFFLATEIESSYKTTLANARPFTNNQVKSNAWQFDFAAVDNSAAGSKSKIHKYQGKVVYALGKNEHVYFLVTSVDYNWRLNQQTWQQVLDSIKIDQ